MANEFIDNYDSSNIQDIYSLDTIRIDDSELINIGDETELIDKVDHTNLKDFAHADQFHLRVENPEDKFPDDDIDSGGDGSETPTLPDYEVVGEFVDKVDHTNLKDFAHVDQFHLRVENPEDEFPDDDIDSGESDEEDSGSDDNDDSSDDSDSDDTSGSTSDQVDTPEDSMETTTTSDSAYTQPTRLDPDSVSSESEAITYFISELRTRYRFWEYDMLVENIRDVEMEYALYDALELINQETPATSYTLLDLIKLGTRYRYTLVVGGAMCCLRTLQSIWTANGMDASIETLSVDNKLSDFSSLYDSLREEFQERLEKLKAYDRLCVTQSTFSTGLYRRGSSASSVRTYNITRLGGRF